MSQAVHESADILGMTPKEEDGRHLGLIYLMDIESPELAESLRKKEFRRSRGHSLAGGFREIGQLVSRMDEVDLEPWSRAILRKCEEFSE